MLYPLSYEGSAAQSRPPRAGEMRACPPTMGRMPKATVLAVDDDPVTLGLLRASFEMEGYRFLAAANGVEGMAVARRERPDVVILDVVMPGPDGLTVARALKADGITAGTPVIILSARAQERDVTRGRAVADDYVTKPFDPLDLLERVGKAIAARP